LYASLARERNEQDILGVHTQSRDYAT